MSAAIDYSTGSSAGQFGAIPHRKPLPSGPRAAYPAGVAGNDYQSYTRQSSHHTHTRSASSSAMPYNGPPPSYANYQSQMHMQPMTARRTLSNATSSTQSSGPPPNAMDRAPTNTSYASSIRRSTSSRSQQQSTPYVALLRRQKATVWCERSQQEDARVLAQHRQAKMRANMEVVGGVHPGSRASTSSAGGVRSKIRHHGAVKASAFQGQNMSGAGVPMRLSASEVDDNDSDDDRLRNTRYAITGSGRSSLSSGHRASMTTAPQLQQRVSSSEVTPSRNSYSPTESRDPRHVSPSEETPVPVNHDSSRDYFTRDTRTGTGTSGGSASSEERGFGEMSRLPIRREGDEQQSQQKKKTNDELRRRGSVDDRTMTMSGVRLFVANPDLSD